MPNQPFAVHLLFLLPPSPLPPLLLLLNLLKWGLTYTQDCPRTQYVAKCDLEFQTLLTPTLVLGLQVHAQLSAFLCG